MPSILMFLLGGITIVSVLNLVISGMPSIPPDYDIPSFEVASFKPCYKWNAFNT